MDVHELTAAYALDALDPDERERYEAHLSACESCRDELEGFWEAAGALGRAAGGPPPPAALRERILEQARSERATVVPLRRRWVAPVLSGAAAVAAVAAIGIGIWAASLAGRLDEAERELAVLGDPNAQTYASAGGEATLVVSPGGAAALVVGALAPAPEGMDYEIWVLDGGVARRAGLFEDAGVVRLLRPVAPGQAVAVTLERDGGVDAPTGEPLFTASTAT